MAAFRYPRNSQPQRPVGIDWSNPITRGLAFASTSIVYDSISGIVGSPTGGTKPVVVVGGKGVSSRFSAASLGGGYINFGNLAGVDLLRNGGTILTLIRISDVTIAQSIAGKADNVANNGWVLQCVSGGVLHAKQIGSSNGSVSTSAGALVTNKWHAVALRWRGPSVGVGLELFVDGLLLATGTSPTGTLVSDNTLPLKIGSQTYTNGASRDFNGDSAVFLGTRRALSDIEIKSLSANPWQIFTPQSRQIWVPTSAGGDTYTLPADSAAFALAGQDAGLAFNRVLAADTASVALNGQAASLAFNRTLVADTSGYALTGQNAALTQNRVLSAASGAYALTGQNAALIANRVLVADTTSYALTGQSATLTHTPVSGATYTLTADSASLTLAGQDAGLTLHRKLIADTQAFALAMQDAALTRGFVMPPASGDYAISGQNAALITSRRLAADSAAMALTGQDAALTYTPIGGPNYTLTADTVNVAITGQNAALIYSAGATGVYPLAATVLAGITYGPTGADYTGTLTWPTAESIAAQVRTELAAELMNLNDLAKVHGLIFGTDLVVTPTARTAGDVVQAIGTAGDTVTVSRAP